MAIGQEIRTQIASTKNTRKITHAMELVAASKMRKAQERLFTSRPYATKLEQVAHHVAASSGEYPHPWLLQREIVARVGYLVVSTDRGLCGGLNSNLFKLVLGSLTHWKQQGVDAELGLIGRRATSFFRRFPGTIVASRDHLGDAPSVADVIGVLKTLLDAYDSGRIEVIYLCYNRFVSTMSQEPVVKQLLPLTPPETTSKLSWDYLYEPNAKALVDLVLMRYVELLTYQAVVENSASEQAARMLAMSNATGNAGEIINALQLQYNKARQAVITREIAEIVAGAEAV